MAPDDRDRNFEKALAQQARANAVDAFDCPDAETLAAYHERMLSAQEMAAYKSHIAACPRCQEILATLEITEAIPVEAEENQGVVAKGAARTLAAVHAEPVFSAPVQMAAAGGKSSPAAQMPKRNFYLRWIAPAGAIAAGFLVWVAINGGWNAQKQAKSPAPIEIAENREQKAVELSSPKPEVQAAKPLTEPKKLQPAMRQEIGGEYRRKQELDAAVTSSRSDANVRGRASAPSAVAHGPKMMQNQVQNQIQNGIQDSYINQKAGVNSDQASAPVAGQRVLVPPANAPSPTQQPPNIATANEAPAPAPSAKEADKDSKGNVAAATSTVEVAAEAVDTKKQKKADELKRSYELAGNLSKAVGGAAAASLRDGGAFDDSFIHTPDPQIFWFGGGNGTIFKTKDGGKTVFTQSTGAGVKVLSGSAADTNVCWLVAQNGMVLRTVDGGDHWTKIAAPASVSFMFVSATDALHAILSDVSGQVRFATNDGGLTWAVVPKP